MYKANTMHKATNVVWSVKEPIYALLCFVSNLSFWLTLTSIVPLSARK